MTHTQITEDLKGHLERLREAELAAVQNLLRPGMKVLELGGGSGYQAQLISKLGCEVVSVDIPDSRPKIFYPVQEFDGQNIPAEDNSFDAIFSSNVLEHVDPLAPLLAEIRRVLKPGGVAIHIMPSSVWRFWSSSTAYLFVLKSLLGIKSPFPLVADATTPNKALSRFGLVRTLKRALTLPLSPHGEYRNALVELYSFSRHRWVKVFQKNGFKVVKLEGNHLFYTGYGIIPSLSLNNRRKTSKVLGSACTIYVTEPASASS